METIEYINIAKAFEINDESLKKVESLVNDPLGYYDENIDKYEERGMENDNIDDILWIGLVDILIEDEIVFEFDNSVEYEDFKYYMSVIDKDNILELDADVYDADETICEWLTISQKQANDKKASVGGIDIDSDSYCVFVSAKSKFDKLSELAQLIGRRIVYADEL